MFHFNKLFDYFHHREKVGNLICCKLTGDRFGNHRFLSMTTKYMSEDILQAEVTEMIFELVPDEGDGKSLKSEAEIMIQRTYSQGNNVLRITASTIPNNPQIIMFVSKERNKN